jgi:hypothetical protein
MPRSVCSAKHFCTIDSDAANDPNSIANTAVPAECAAVLTVERLIGSAGLNKRSINWPRTSLAMLLMSAWLVFPGCSSGHPKTISATGIVIYQGQPVEGAQVMFYCKTGRPAEGVTDAADRFTLTTFRENDGALVGEHSVVISKPIHAGSPAEKAAGDNPHASSSDSHGAGTAPRQAIPSRYTLPSQSPLQVTVTLGGSNDYKFDLTD